MAIPSAWAANQYGKPLVMTIGMTVIEIILIDSDRRINVFLSVTHRRVMPIICWTSTVYVFRYRHGDMVSHHTIPNSVWHWSRHMGTAISLALFALYLTIYCETGEYK
jgi:hypothetical protein